MRLGGFALAALSLAGWTHLAGIGVGVCTTLGCWMLSLMMVPCLALLGAGRRGPPVESADVG